MQGRRLMMTAAAGMALVACGGGGGEPGAQPTTPAATSPSPSPTVACTASGTALHVSSSGTAFDTDCLAAPADTSFTIEFENTDGNTHNIAIQNGEQFFDGDTFAGPKTVTYEIPPIPAGSYTFYCKVHPGPMQGTFIAE